MASFFDDFPKSIPDYKRALASLGTALIMAGIGAFFGGVTAGPLAPFAAVLGAVFGAAAGIVIGSGIHVKLTKARSMLQIGMSAGGLTFIGAAIGGLLGSMVFPGFGTLAGAAIGGSIAYLCSVMPLTGLFIFNNYDSHFRRADIQSDVYGTVAMTGAGAAIGAILGTFIFPGLGTGIGAAIGAGFGASLGLTGVGVGRLRSLRGTNSYVALGIMTSGTVLTSAGVGMLIGMALFPGPGLIIGGVIGAAAGLLPGAITLIAAKWQEGKTKSSILTPSPHSLEMENSRCMGRFYEERDLQAYMFDIPNSEKILYKPFFNAPIMEASSEDDDSDSDQLSDAIVPP